MQIACKVILFSLKNNKKLRIPTPFYKFAQGFKGCLDIQCNYSKCLNISQLAFFINLQWALIGRVADWPIMARHRFTKNAYWAITIFSCLMILHYHYNAVELSYDVQHKKGPLFNQPTIQTLISLLRAFVVHLQIQRIFLYMLINIECPDQSTWMLMLIWKFAT